MNRIRYFRLYYAEKTLDELAQLVGISRSKISRAELGFAKLNENEKKLIAKALNAKMEAVFPEE